MRCSSSHVTHGSAPSSATPSARIWSDATDLAQIDAEIAVHRVRVSAVAVREREPRRRNFSVDHAGEVWIRV